MSQCGWTIADFGIGDSFFHVDGKKIENVRGDVRVPNGTYVALRVNDNSKLPLLSTLASDSLDGLLLSSIEVTDDGLSHLSNLTALSYLDLGYTWVTDDGLSHLSNLTALSHLDLYSTKVTDDGLSHLYNLTSLTNLDLGGTGVSKAGIQRLRDLLPDCQISSWF